MVNKKSEIAHTRKWEAPAAAVSLLLPHICRRWEALAAAASLLLPHARRRLHWTTRWRCGWWLLLLIQDTWRMEESFDDSPSNSSGYNNEYPHVKEVSSYELLDFNCF
jgi:hypothetical protein